MKKQFVIILALIFSSFFTHAQSLKAMAESEMMTWYGIDFTTARFQNFGAYLSDKTVKTGLPRWSMHPFGADDLATFKKKYKKDKIAVADAQAATRNKEQDYTAQMTTGAHELNMDSLKTVVAQYEMKGTGYGLLFIVESFEYTKKKTNIWAVYINEADKTIIDAKKVTKETFGDWFVGVTETVQQGAKYMKNAK